MNAQANLGLLDSTAPLATRLFALLATETDDTDAPEARWLSAQAAAHKPTDLARTLALWQRMPADSDAHLHRLAQRMKLSGSELIAVALALAADADVIAARALAWLQAPLRDMHPTLGLIACLEAQRGLTAHDTVTAILDGPALESGLLQLEGQGRALPDARLRVPLSLVVALAGGNGRWQNVHLGDPGLPELPDSIHEAAAAYARRSTGVLAVRSGHRLEARAACAAIAAARQRPPAFIEGEPPAGLVPWLLLHNAQPVICLELGPGERRPVPSLPCYDELTLIASGPDGGFEVHGETVPSWSVPVPSISERIDLWRKHGASDAEAKMLGATHRHSSSCIARLAREAAQAGAPLTSIQVSRIARAAGQGALGTLAVLVSDDVLDEALILSAQQRAELEALVTRCRNRDALADGLGPAARARYRPGVRALFVGASGTGKTLACSWLACRLGVPLYRVDMASVNSKYIGETEKNLGELFARAENSDVILLFDEADALFGKRTDVKDSNDRFANQQTNYLLQRIEAFDGIVLLTSNSRTRFDSAFTRRLDAILEFPAPAADERRALWQAHLGENHTLDVTALNRLAGNCELTGGHIRNVVLTARALTSALDIAWPALSRALEAEYRKLGKQIPADLASGGS